MQIELEVKEKIFILGPFSEHILISWKNLRGSKIVKEKLHFFFKKI